MFHSFRKLFTKKHIRKLSKGFWSISLNVRSYKTEASSEKMRTQKKINEEYQSYPALLMNLFLIKADT